MTLVGAVPTSWIADPHIGFNYISVILLINFVSKSSSFSESQFQPDQAVQVLVYHI